ncbi:MAG: hypothetical protein IPJ65_34890 [Archangiaceae bacterium]|nr:hypothetical protein [Archangiaceae bacterium]
MKTLVLMVSLMSSVALAEGQVASLRSHVSELDAHKRGRWTTAIKPALLALGAEAVPEMMAQLDLGHDASWSASAAEAWDASLLEAIGSYSDARAKPLFMRVLSDAGQPFIVQRAAAEGLAKLGDLEALAPVIDRDAVVEGIGSLRKLATVELLAAELAKKPGEARAKHLVHALGETGNAWAWKTLRARGEEQAVRNAAAKALVQAFVTYGGEVRQAASNALLVVDSAAAPALIAQAKVSGPAAELDALQTRLNANPLR